MIKKYLDFRQTVNEKYSNELINENIAQAKTFLKNRALKIKKDRMGDSEEPVGLTPQEVKAAEQDRDFLEIVKLAKDMSGYTYVFTKFFYEDLEYLDKSDRIDELSRLLNILKEYRQSIGELPMPVDRYCSKAAIEEEVKSATDEGRPIRSSYERLCDDLEKLKTSKITKKWINELPSEQKSWFTRLTEDQKKLVDAIALGFDLMGSEDGVKDPKANKILTRNFFEKLKDYKTFGDLIISAQYAIKSANNASFKKFLVSLDKVNQKYGELNGTEIKYNENGILIIEVRSYQANKELNSHTKHCIIHFGHWTHYLGDFNKQYYIYNFNLDQTDNKSVIGITIGENNKVTACHLKNDDNFISGIVNHMNSLKLDLPKGVKSPMEIMPGMTKPEVEAKKKKIAASKEIIKDNLSLDKIKELLELGADPNAAKGKVLENSVRESDLEKTKYLLEKGAMPSLNNPIKFAKTMDMIKLLVSYHCELTSEVFKNIMGDIEGVEYVLKAGMDPNFDRGLPVRLAVAQDNKEVLDLLIHYKADLSNRNYLILKVAAQHAQAEIFEYLYNGVENIPSFKKIEEHIKTECLNWAKSAELPQDKIDTMVETITRLMR